MNSQQFIFCYQNVCWWWKHGSNPRQKSKAIEISTVCSQECVRTLLEDERWPALMSVATRRDHGDDVINTPMREMIRQMPDMACLVMTKCIDLSSQKDLKNPEFCVSNLEYRQTATIFNLGLCKWWNALKANPRLSVGEVLCCHQLALHCRSLELAN